MEKKYKKGGASPRIKGDNFERKVKTHLECLGNFVVRQSASKFPDLIVIEGACGNDVVVVECKIAGSISSKEKTDLLQLREKYGMTLVIASNDKGKIKFKRLDGKPYGWFMTD